jgi:hypothetical protein
MKKAFLALCIVLVWAGMSWGVSPGVKVTASKYEKGNKPDNTIDQSGSTWWTCRGYKDECWLQMDLGRVVYHNEIYLVFKQSSPPRENFFDVRLSVDGVTWETVFSGSDVELDNSERDEWHYWGLLEFSPDEELRTYRYVRVYGHGNSVSDHNSITEIGPWAPEMEGLYFERPIVGVKASSHEKANTPERAVDDNLATFWTGGKMGEWIQFDIGEVNAVENIKIAWMNGHRRKADFDIEVSIDGVTWELAHSGTSTGTTLKLETNTLGVEYCARYVRIVGWGNDIKDAKSKVKTSITEVEIWGHGWIEEGTCDDEIAAVAGRM